MATILSLAEHKNTYILRSITLHTPAILGHLLSESLAFSLYTFLVHFSVCFISYSSTTALFLTPVVWSTLCLLLWPACRLDMYSLNGPTPFVVSLFQSNKFVHPHRLLHLNKYKDPIANSVRAPCLYSCSSRCSLLVLEGVESREAFREFPARTMPPESRGWVNVGYWVSVAYHVQRELNNVTACRPGRC